MSVERTRLTLQKFTEIVESDFHKALRSDSTEIVCGEYDALAQELYAAARRLKKLTAKAKWREAHIQWQRKVL